MRVRTFAGRTLHYGMAALLLLVLGISVASAQVDTGAITGSVTDNTGSALPGAKITVKEEATGIQTTVTAGNGGEYSISPLKIGIYTVTVVKDGFKTSIRQHIEVSIQSRLEVNSSLEVGSVTQQVEVQSTTPVLDTQTSSIQQLVEGKTINDLPLSTRNAVFLAQLSPGVTFAQNDSRNLQSSGSFTANGTRRTQNDYLLDGMDNNVAIGDLVNQGQAVIVPPPDALREFTVQTSNYSAEFGHAAGAVLNMTTKSGQNAFHGDVYEYLRNDYIAAQDYFTGVGQHQEYRQNEFGATLGGPLSIPHVYNGKDRTFFFVDYQGERQIIGKNFTVTVPTLAEQNSGFKNLNDLIVLQQNSNGTYSTTTDALGRVFPKGTVFDPATTRAIAAGATDPVTGLTNTGAATYVRDPFYTGVLTGKTGFTDAGAVAALNAIPAGRINQTAANLLRLYPNPTNGAVTKNFVTNPNATTYVNSFDTRVDEQFSQKDSAFFRYSYSHTDQKNPGPFPGIADGSASRPGSGYTEAQNGALSYTRVISAVLVDEARVGYSRVFDKRLQFDANVMGVPAQYGIPGVPQLAENGGLPLFEFNQMANLGQPATTPSDKASDIWQVTDNLTIAKNKHQMRAGFEYQHVGFPEATPSQSRGDFVHNGLYTSVYANTDGSTDRAQFVIIPQATTVPGGINNLGGANTLNATSFPPVYNNFRNYWGGYFQDSWRATKELTLNLGIRYEYIGVPGERDGRIATFVPSATGDSPDGANHYYIPQNQVANLSAAFVTFLGANNIVITPTQNNLIGYAQKTNFAPRVGFAFAPGDKMSLRGGFGMFYQPNENHGLSTSPFVNYPFQVSNSYTAGNGATPLTADASIGPVWQGLQSVSFSTTSVNPAVLAFQGEPRFQRTAYTEAFSLQFQYQVAPSTILFAGFVGSNSHHMQTSIGANAVTKIAPTNVTQKSVSMFPNLATGGSYVTHDGGGNYNSLQFGGERRFNNGLAFLANFTWGKCMTTIRDLLDNGVGGYRAPYVIGLGPDDIPCDINVKRILHTSGTYELPFGYGKKMLTHGPAAWVAGNWSLNWIVTAQDGQPLSVACASTTAIGLGCFATKTGVDPYSGKHNVTQYLNPAAFATPAAATATYTPTTVLGGPGAQVTGPPFRRLDLSLFRRIPVVNKSYLEFRAELFNVTNTPNFAQPGQLNYTTTATFAQITATRDNPNDQRILQLSGKYYF